jgi:hypothetical protein
MFWALTLVEKPYGSLPASKIALCHVPLAQATNT